MLAQLRWVCLACRCVWVELGAAAPPARVFFGRLRNLLKRMFPGTGMGMCAAGYGG